ncbi:hypothetical protein [Streptomyces sp. NBC_01217]|uniref:hypothetical protein n=1 Tax=Streptomyces sp. NBC_01217 TaxID=2903779 RepID=UPI002E0F8C0B|nr:hypothetical protein OG507_01220 [Streptomyces sp. NBC_01217]
MTSKGWGIAAVAWSVLAVLFLGITVSAGALGLVRLGLAGDEVRVRLSQCRLESSGRGGSHVECSGRLVGDVSMDTVTVRYDGKQGEVVPAARTPWGTFEVVDKSFTSWGTAVLYPLLPLVAAALTSYLALRSGRRGKRQTAPSAS